ncbi:MAG: hypothetical protein Q8N56_01010 [bacterium]|nr:hypothetical protein [bacterium]
MTNYVPKNIFLRWLLWFFTEAPLGIVKGWKNILIFNFNYFSVPLLLKTLFAFWRQYQWYYPRSFSPGKYLEVFFSNSISRVLGAIIRLSVVFLGIITEFFIFIAGIIAVILWFFLPILIIWSGVLGIKLLLK